MAIKVFFSLGSNIGQRKKNIEQAVFLLTLKIDKAIISGIYETKPMFISNQPKFLNAVVSGVTKLTCKNLLKFTQSVEKKLGRNRKKEDCKGPRIIDIDILLYGEKIICSDLLSIPHPGIKERQFVLIPLIEIAPKLRNPKNGELYSNSLQNLSDQGVYYYTNSSYTNKKA